MEELKIKDENNILKLIYLGYSGNCSFTDISNWLYSKFQIEINYYNSNFFISFQNIPLFIYYRQDIDKIINIILQLWKCINGKLEGPSIKNYEDPEEWT